MNKHFLTGSLLGLLAFLLINLLAAHLASDCGLPALFGSDACADDITRAGWPLTFYEEGGFAYRQTFEPLPLLVNLATGLVVATLSGWLFSRWKKTPAK
jgi:hypothetical protein